MKKDNATAKQNAIQAALFGATGKPLPSDTEIPARARAAKTTSARKKADNAATSYTGSRRGKRMLGFYADNARYTAVHLLMAEEGKPLQHLMQEAIDLLLIKKGKGRWLARNAR